MKIMYLKNYFKQSLLERVSLKVKLISFSFLIFLEFSYRIVLLILRLKNKKSPIKIIELLLLGGRWDSNPRPLEPQTSALTN